MNKFKVHASYITFCTVEIEAENEDEAYRIACEMDGGDFTQDNQGDWEIDYVKEIKEAA
jgi:hypothetical protein